LFSSHFKKKKEKKRIPGEEKIKGGARTAKAVDFWNAGLRLKSRRRKAEEVGRCERICRLLTPLVEVGMEIVQSQGQLGEFLFKDADHPLTWIDLVGIHVFKKNQTGRV